MSIFAQQPTEDPDLCFALDKQIDDLFGVDLEEGEVYHKLAANCIGTQSFKGHSLRQHTLFQVYS